MHLLDTNICMYHLNGRHPEIEERLRELQRSERGTTSITVAELHYGARRSSRAEANLLAAERLFSALVIFDFDRRAAAEYGRVKHILGSAGQPIGRADLFIAAIALSHEATLVTNNVREFSRVPGLRIENWLEADR
jgi:tRNA(fMet)-specific endonuclease VapC